MKGLLSVICMLGLLVGTAVAEEPHQTGGVPGPPWQGEDREDYCQYGFQDDMISSGWTLGLGQQLGIQCAGPVCIAQVGFYVEFTVWDGELDIVIHDNGVEVSRTTLPPGAVVAGQNQFPITPNVDVSGDACIMLCAVDDAAGYWSVLGEDMTNGPFGNTFFSNECFCTNEFTDNNLTMWAVLCEPTPVEDSTWGRIRTMYR
jgi:hypothetical protein